MTKEYLTIRSDLGKAKSLGSSAHGSHHWLMQRLSAILMIPLFLWAAYFFHAVSTLQYNEVLHVMKQPWNLVPLLLLLTTGLYHGMLGMQVVIEDYISCIKWRTILILMLKLFTYVTIFSVLVAAIYFLTKS